MKIKYQTKEYTIGIKDLDPPTIASLKKHIKKTISGLKDIEMNRLSLFLNKKKILASDDKELDSQDLQITDESTIFLIVTQSFSEGNENNSTTERAKSTADIPQQQQQSPNPFGLQPNDSQFMQNMMNNPNMYNAMNSPSMYGFMNNQQGGMGVPSGLEKQLIEQIINNPDSILQMIESQMPNMPEEQKAFLKSNIELMKKNPEMIRQIYSQINNPMMGNPMMGNPMMNNNMMQSPMMNNNPRMQNNPMMQNNHMMQNNPAMQSPMMQNNPAMQSPMMQNNPMMSNPAMQNAYFMAPPPPDGPCFHGYYPLKNVDGVLRQRDPKEVYASKIELLKDMGFPDEEINLSVLVETKGNMDAAVVKLTKKMEEEE